VQVRHDPDDPSLACLEPGTGDWQWVPLSIAACAVFLGGGVGWFLPRKIDAKIHQLESAPAEA
jgi:membrane protein YqaA with SNARE-associated domain